MFESTSEKPHLRQALAGDLKQGWDSTERLTNRLESYAILKQRTQKFYDWAMVNNVSSEGIKYRKAVRELDKCGQYLIFRNYLVSLRTRLIGSCSCKQHLLCACCASRRGVKYSMTYKEKFAQLQQDLNQGGFFFITFTVKNGPDLDERYRHLKHSMQKLTRWRSDYLKQKVTVQTEMAKVEGGVFSYEFKRGSNSNEWHPHIHMLAVTDNCTWIDVEQLKKEWQEVTGDSFVVNIREADDNA
ncbi:protein rep, partial [Methylicorpusculum sp.]|uniref:protein rep n=1 Tax=Methylicorpusculum sp. TaxID=2713644 RepID=UPI002AB8F2E9